MTAGGYAEVFDAIRQQPTTERESRVIVDLDYSCIADEQPQETITERDGVTSSGNSSIRKNKKGKPKVLPPPRHQSLAKEKVAAVCAGGRALSRHNSTEHLYDSVNESLDSRDHMYHVLESPKTGNRQEDTSHLYQVLDGPTIVDPPDLRDDQGPPKGLNPPLPLPKPLPGYAKKRRVQSCVGGNSVQLNDLLATSGSVSSGKKSIESQVRSVMAIYEEVPAEGKSRSSSAILLPPPIKKKPETKSGVAKKEKEPVYHALEECSSAEDASRGTSGTEEQLKKEQTVKTNSDSVFQKDPRENAALSNVCKTESTGFQSELPKATKRTHSEKAEECKYAEPVSLKKDTESTHVCDLFDDPAYCTQRHTTPSTEKSVGTCAATDKGQPEEPSYATPSTGIKQIDTPSQHLAVLFDDPKYNRPVAREAGVSQIEKVVFDDPRYQPVHGPFHTTNRRVSGTKKRVVRHSSSVENFSHLLYSNTTDFLDASDRRSHGGSLHDLTGKKCSLTSEVYIKVTHL